MKRAIGILLLALSCGGCVSTSVVINADDLSAADTNGRVEVVEGRGCGYQLFSLIPMGTNGRQWRAYQELRSNARGKVLTDIQIEEYWRYGVVGNTYCTRMKAVAFPRLGLPDPDAISR